MTRTPTPVEEALLDALEPEAKAAWLDDVLTITQAIAASQAITDRRSADAIEGQRMVALDTNALAILSLPPETRDELPPEIRTRNGVPVLDENS